MKKTLLLVLVLSSVLAGCIVVPVGHPWHHEYAERGWGPERGGDWHR